MVILTPTRELALLRALEAARLSAHTDLRVATIYGCVSMGQQTDDLRRGVDVGEARGGDFACKALALIDGCLMA